jgi:hypothetical protein
MKREKKRQNGMDLSDQTDTTVVESFAADAERERRTANLDFGLLC